MKIFVIWLAVSGLASASPQGSRMSDEDSSKIESDISKIVPKLPQRIKTDLTGSSKENPTEQYFETIDSSSNNDSSEYIIGDKSKKRYRIKLKKKSHESEEKTSKEKQNTYRYYEDTDSSDNAGELTDLAANRNADTEFNAMATINSRNGYELHSRELTSGLKKNMEKDKPLQSRKKKFKVTTHRTTYTKRKRIHSGKKIGSQKSVDVPEVVQNICDTLNIKAEDVWLLANRYLSLDIHKSEDLNKLKLIYQDFVSYLRNNPNASNISSFKGWLRNSKYWNKNNPQFLFDVSSEDIIKSKHQNLATKESSTEFSSEWVAGNPKYKIIKSKPKIVVEVTSSQNIHKAVNLNNLRKKYQDYVSELIKNPEHKGEMYTFEEWLKSRQAYDNQNNPEYADEDLNKFKNVYQDLVNSKEIDDQMLSSQDLEVTSQNKNIPAGSKMIKEHKFNLPLITSQETSDQIFSSTKKLLGTNLKFNKEDEPLYSVEVVSENGYNPEHLKEVKSSYEELISVEEHDPTKPELNLYKNKPLAVELVSEEKHEPVDLKESKTSYEEMLLENKEFLRNDSEIPLDDGKPETSNKLNNYPQFAVEVASEGIPEPEDLTSNKPNQDLTNESHNPEISSKVSSIKDWFNTNAEYFDENIQRSMDEDTPGNIDKEKANFDEPVDSSPKSQPLNYNQASSDITLENIRGKNLLNEGSHGSADRDIHNIPAVISMKAHSVGSTTSPDMDKLDVPESKVVHTEDLNEVSLEGVANEESSDVNIRSSEISTEKSTMPGYNQDHNINPAENKPTAIINDIGIQGRSTEMYIINENEKEINNDDKKDTVEAFSSEDQIKKYSDDNDVPLDFISSKVPHNAYKKPSNIIPPVNIVNDELTSKEMSINNELDTDSLARPFGKGSNIYANIESPSTSLQPNKHILVDDMDPIQTKHRKILDGLSKGKSSSLIQLPNTKIANSRENYKNLGEYLAANEVIEPITKKSIELTEIYIDKEQTPNYFVDDPLFVPHLFKPLKVDPALLQMKPGTTKMNKDDINQILNKKLPITNRKIARVHPDKSRQDIYRELILKQIKMFPEFQSAIKNEIHQLDKENYSKEHYGLNPSLFDDVDTVTDTQLHHKFDPIGSSEIIPELQIPRPNNFFKSLRSKPQIKETTLDEFISFFDPIKLQNTIKHKDIDLFNEADFQNDDGILGHTITGSKFRDKIQPQYNILNDRKQPKRMYFLLVPSSITTDEEFKNTPWYNFIMRSDGTLDQNGLLEINEKKSFNRHLDDPITSRSNILGKTMLPSISNAAESLLDVPKPDYVYYFRLLASDILKETTRRIESYLKAAGVPRANIKFIIDRITSEMLVYNNIGSTKCPSEDVNTFIEILKSKIKKYVLAPSKKLYHRRK